MIIYGMGTLNTILPPIYAAYATSPSMTLKYSGQTVDMHYPYPPLIASMQSMVEKALGGDVRFNHVMLNLYERGDVYIGKHSDHLDNKVSDRSC